MKEKVLICAPTSSHKDYILYDFVALIKNLNFENYDLFICDNSKVDRTKMWDEFGIKSKWVNPKGKTPIEFICESQNVIRNYFLDNKEYTHLMFIESDLLPTPDCVGILLAHNKPIVGFPYFINKSDDTLLMLEEIDLMDEQGATRMYSLGEAFNKFDGKLYRTFHIGFGCVIFQRWVIEKIKFRCIPDEKVQNQIHSPSHSDSFFYADCLFKGVPVFVDKSFIVPHYNQNYQLINF